MSEITDLHFLMSIILKMNKCSFLLICLLGITYHNTFSQPLASAWWELKYIFDKKPDPNHIICGYSQKYKYFIHYSEKFYDNSELEKSILCYTKAIKIYPDGTKAYVGRARAYTALGQYEKAIADYTVLIRIGKKPLTYLLARAELWAQQGNLPAALADCNHALKLDPGNSDCFFLCLSIWQYARFMAGAPAQK